MTDTIRIPARHIPAQQPPGPRPRSARRLLIGVRAFTSLSLGGVAVFSTLAAEHDWTPAGHLLGTATCVILAAVGGALLVLERMFASRRDAYVKGELDGWWRGWNGRPPGVDEPGLN